MILFWPISAERCRWHIRCCWRKYSLAGGQTDKARETLAGTRGAYPDEIVTWTRLIALEQEQSKVAEVDRLLAEARQKFGDVPQIRNHRSTGRGAPARR